MPVKKGKKKAATAPEVELTTKSKPLPTIAVTTTTTVEVYALNASSTYGYATNLSSTVPFTWTTNDAIYVAGSLEAAAAA